MDVFARLVVFGEETTRASDGPTLPLLPPRETSAPPTSFDTLDRPATYGWRQIQVQLGWTPLLQSIDQSLS
jgi:hypothetical protein